MCIRLDPTLVELVVATCRTCVQCSRLDFSTRPPRFCQLRSHQSHVFPEEFTLREKSRIQTSCHCRHCFTQVGQVVAQHTTPSVMQLWQMEVSSCSCWIKVILFQLLIHRPIITAISLSQETNALSSCMSISKQVDYRNR